MDINFWNVIIGALIPLIVEWTSKLKGWKQLFVAIGYCFLATVIKVKIEGNLNLSNIDSILGTLVVIFTSAQIFWRTTFSHIKK